MLVEKCCTRTLITFLSQPFKWECSNKMRVSFVCFRCTVFSWSYFAASSQQQSQQSTPAVNRSQQQSAFIRLAHLPAFGACCLSLCKVVKCSSKRGARDRHGGDLGPGLVVHTALYCTVLHIYWQSKKVANALVWGGKEIRILTINICSWSRPLRRKEWKR